jgi:hypothetical protein
MEGRSGDTAGVVGPEVGLMSVEVSQLCVRCTCSSQFGGFTEETAEDCSVGNCWPIAK